MEYIQFRRFTRCIINIAIAILLIGCGKKDTFEVPEDLSTFSDLVTERQDTLLETADYNFQVKQIVIHCTATPTAWSVERLLDFFKNTRKWSRPGYHYYIERDGTVHNIHPTTSRTNGSKGFNTISLHIAYDGGVDKNLTPKDTRTCMQKSTMDDLVDSLRNVYHVPVIGHTNLNSGKACPSFDAVKYYFKGDILDSRFDMPSDSIL